MRYDYVLEFMLERETRGDEFRDFIVELGYGTLKYKYTADVVKEALKSSYIGALGKNHGLYDLFMDKEIAGAIEGLASALHAWLYILKQSGNPSMKPNRYSAEGLKMLEKHAGLKLKRLNELMYLSIFKHVEDRG